jgi:competence protein ComEA
MREKLEDWVEKYKYHIGGALLILILIGGGILLWRDNIYKPKLESRIRNQELRIEKLESEIKELNSKTAGQDTGIENTAETGSADQGTVAGTSTDSSSKSTKVSGKININTATAAQLDSLPGIGEAYAARIIEYRQSNGGFKTIEEIKNVKGIGDKTFEKLKNLITV